MIPTHKIDYMHIEFFFKTLSKWQIFFSPISSNPFFKYLLGTEHLPQARTRAKYQEYKDD